MVFKGRSRYPIYITMAIGLVVYIVLSVIPSIATALISLTDYSGIPGVPVHFVGFANYTHEFLMDAIGLKRALIDTLIFALSVTLIQNALGLLLAVLLNKRMPGRALFRSLVFLPAILGVTVIGLTWSLIFNPSGGPASNLLQLWGASSAFFGSNTWAMPLVIFVQIWASVGFTTIVYLAGISAIPSELYEAGVIDGASGWKTFRFITFPMLAPSTTVNVLLTVIGSLNTYDLIYVLTNGLHNTNTLGMYMFNTAFESGNLGSGAAISMVQFVITLVIVLILQKYLRRREAML